LSLAVDEGGAEAEELHERVSAPGMSALIKANWKAPKELKPINVQGDKPRQGVPMKTRGKFRVERLFLYLGFGMALMILHIIVSAGMIGNFLLSFSGTENLRGAHCSMTSRFKEADRRGLFSGAIGYLENVTAFLSGENL